MKKCAECDLDDAKTDEHDGRRGISSMVPCKKANVTAALLSETQVGKDVKKLSKQDVDKEVAAAAAAVVTTWKKVLLG